MRLRAVAAGLVVAVSLSPACNPLPHKAPKVEAYQQKALEKALIGTGTADTSGKDIFGVPAIPKK